MKTHVEQVAAWGKLSGLCQKLGDSYNPSQDSMKGTALENLLRQSQKSVEAVHNAETALLRAINAREPLVMQLPEMAARILAALQASGAPEPVLKDVNRIRKRFSYQPLPKTEATAHKKSSAEQAMPTDTSGRQAEPSTSGESSTPVRGKRNQLDIGSRIDNLALLVRLIEETPEYVTYEEGIKTCDIKNMLEVLREKHRDVIEAYAAVHDARSKREPILYGPDGIHGRAKLIKAYFRAKFGYRSSAFQTVRKIKFGK